MPREIEPPDDSRRMDPTLNSSPVNSSFQCAPSRVPSRSGSPNNELSTHTYLRTAITDSLRRENGLTVATDVRAINEHLNYLLYVIDIEGDEFTSSITRVAQPNQPVVFRPSSDFVMTLSHCGYIVQDAAAETARHYLIPVTDPFLFDLGSLVLHNLEIGASSVEKVLQLAALGLRRLRAGV